MSYPYPPMGPDQPPSGGQPGSWDVTAPGGYGVPTQPGYAGPGYGPPPEVGGYPGMGGPPMGPPPKKSSAGVIVAVIFGALLLVGGTLGGAYYLAAHGGDDQSSASASPSASSSTSGSSGGVAPVAGGGGKPANYNSMKSWSLWDKLNTASGDSKPLTLDEVFADPEAKAYKDSSDNTTFNLQGTGRLDSACGTTVTGTLASSLTTYGCTQVVRAAYVSDDQRWVGQIAIFNLRDVGSANSFLDDLDPKAGKGFFVPLTGASPVDKFGTSPTGAESGAYGHFVVVGWAGRVDGAQGDSLGIDTISASSAVQQAGKQFLFHRNIG